MPSPKSKSETGSTEVEPPRLLEGLEPGRLESDVELEGLVITEQDLSDGGVFDLSLEGSRLERCRLTGAVFERLALKDCEFVDCEMSGAFLKSMEAERVRFAGCRMTGAVMTSAAMHHVRFDECLMEGVNLRMFEGLVLAFDTCEMREIDFYGGSLTNSTFTASDLTGAEFSKLQLDNVCFAGGSLAELRGALSLRGGTISSDLVMPLVPLVFAEAGIRIEDGSEPDQQDG